MLLGLLSMISYVVVSVPRTIVPRRDLGPRVDCSHTIVPWGARWCLSTCEYELLRLSFHATLKTISSYSILFKGVGRI